MIPFIRVSKQFWFKNIHFHFTFDSSLRSQACTQRKGREEIPSNYNLNTFARL